MWVDQPAGESGQTAGRMNRRFTCRYPSVLGCLTRISCHSGLLPKAAKPSSRASLLGQRMILHTLG